MDRERAIQASRQANEAAAALDALASQSARAEAAEDRALRAEQLAAEREEELRHGASEFIALRGQRDRAVEALREVGTNLFLTPDWDHRRLAEACGTDACIVCLATAHIDKVLAQLDNTQDTGDDT